MNQVFVDWKSEPVTQEFFKSLHALLAELRERNGMGEALEGDKPLLRYAEQAGICRGLQMALDHVPVWAEQAEREA